ncbi:DUF4279 domain-containing protein [Bacillus timonensis]|nr:DUF4279 domain-containing protein [Bacillus timonensis]
MIDSGSCSLIIKGEGLDFSEISKTLKINPTREMRKGVVYSSIFGPNKEDFWIYELKVNENQSPNDTLSTLLSYLSHSKQFIVMLSKSHNVSIKCYIQSSMAQIGFDLSPPTIVELSKLNVKLEFSILSWGGVEG